MAVIPKMTALTFSADDESSLEKSVIEALAGCTDLNMGLRRCAAFEAKNEGYFLCELTTKGAKSFIKSLTDKVKGRLFIEHSVIQLVYVPLILNTTHAVAELKLKNMATGDELYGGTKVNLNEAFLLTLSWPRSLLASAVDRHKGLYLGGTMSCAPSVQKGETIGMWYPLWTEKISGKQLYQKHVEVTRTKAIETFAKTIVSSDREMRSMLRSRISIGNAAKTFENPVTSSSSIGLLDGSAVGVDFTVKQLDETPAGADDNNTGASDVLVPKNAVNNNDRVEQQTEEHRFLRA
ncbi:putative movement protein [Peanut virus C]|nr:putative movement protein [Peanut virus C]